MIVYIFPFITLLMLSFKDVFGRKISVRRESILLSLLLLYLSILAGIRHGIGIDYFTYQNIFHGINDFSDYNYLEPGFRLLVVFFKSIGVHSQWLFFVFALITLVLLVKSITKNSYYPLLSLFLYLCIFYTGYVFNVLRQGIAMSIFLISLQYIEERRIWRVLLLSLIGTSIHYSGIFIIIGYIFTKISIKRKTYIILLLISIGLIFASNLYAGKIISFMPAIISQKLISYSNTFRSSIDLVGLIQRVLLFIPLLMYYPMLNKVDKKFEIIFKLYFLGFLFYSLFSFQGLLATRINMFYKILEILLIPYLFALRIKTFDKLLLFLFVILWGGIIYYSVFRSPYFYPFITIFN